MSSSGISLPGGAPSACNLQGDSQGDLRYLLTTVTPHGKPSIPDYKLDATLTEGPACTGQYDRVSVDVEGGEGRNVDKLFMQHPSEFLRVEDQRLEKLDAETRQWWEDRRQRRSSVSNEDG
ncbi:hypothetical protein JB92DRAFT_3101639 [Gautieria morchelliformis]|nr:hypothetical protein JB92DRAFT_3101639 [Gautieria morchelliformis]